MRNRHETSRLDALHQLKLLDTPASESFDRITRMASQIFGLPVAAVSLTDHDRQWFKSRVGVDHCSIPRAGAPCAEVAESTQALVIEDFLEDPDYAESPLGRAGTRFYAGAPLVTNEGYGLGALRPCLNDRSGSDAATRCIGKGWLREIVHRQSERGKSRSARSSRSAAFRTRGRHPRDLEARSAWPLDPRSDRVGSGPVRPQCGLSLPDRWVRHGYSFWSTPVSYIGLARRDGT